MKDFLKKLLDKTFWKFILVGIINTLVGNGTMFLVYLLLPKSNGNDLSYWIASASNYIVGSIVSYFLNKYFTFQYKKKSWKVVARFALNITVCWLIAYGAAKPLFTWLLSASPKLIQDIGAMLAGSGLFIILNYFGQRFFAFREDEK